MSTALDAAGRLRRASALRELCLRLPHLATPAELARLRRFEALAVTPESATAQDIDALVVGWRTWWRAGQTEQLRAMAARVPRAIVGADRRLAAYAVATNV